jgi:hypothetical protein
MPPDAAVRQALLRLGYSLYEFGRMLRRYSSDVPRWIAALEAKYNKTGAVFETKDFDSIFGDYDISLSPLSACI